MDITKHLSFTQSNAIADIAQPLFDTLPITDFGYSVMYPDGKRCVLYSNPQDFYDCYQQDRWFFQTYKNQLTPFDLLPQKLNYYYFQSDLAGNLGIDFTEIRNVGIEMVKFYRKNRQVSDFFYITSKHSKFSESFIFSCKNQACYKTTLLNNLDLLLHFTHYFKSRSNKLIDQSLNEPVMKPWRENVNLWHYHEKNIILTPDKNEFIQKHPLEKLSITTTASPLVECHLTKKELDCADHLARGLSAREISEKTYRSKRTVETHIDHLKTKLNVKSKSELIAKILDLNLVR